MRVDKRLSPNESNDIISELLKNNNNFLISRVGLGGETIVSAFKISNQQIPKEGIYWFYNNAGFYGEPNFDRFSTLYGDACKNSDLHAYWNYPGFIEMEDLLVPNEKVLIDISSLESFRFDNPWTKHLKGKKILIINPFKTEIDNQLKIRDKLWDNKNILPDAEYITYKSIQSIGGEGPHKNWYESFDIMCDDISKIDFDVAMIGCGSYGLPISNHIKKMGKSAIYIGGGLQLYFGIKGKRWDNSPDVTKFYNDHWIRPEKTKNSDNVEGGCYW
jgi:hypothetical protein